MTRIFDGAFGTYFAEIGGDCLPCEAANLSAPESVRAVHREYRAAGADCLLTNTFAANPDVFPNADELSAVIRAGYALAREESAGARVFASIGPIAGDGEYARVAFYFLSAGADAFMFETLPDLTGIAEAARQIKSVRPDATVSVSFAVGPDGTSRTGADFRQLVLAAADCPHVDIVGLNCVCGPTHMLKMAPALAGVRKPLCLRPNAGYSAARGGATGFTQNADYFAARLAELAALPVMKNGYVGGCCGTTPAHIRGVVRAIAAGAGSPGWRRTGRVRAPGAARLPSKPIAVELDPPSDADISPLISGANRLKACGATTITLSDSPLARSRADSFLTAVKLKAETSMDVLPHITCRDRNLNAVRGAVLGASFFGVNKVLCVTGDPSSFADARNLRDVYHFSSADMIRFVGELNAGALSRRPVTIGAALNVNAANFDAELRRAKRKADGGATMFFTQPIFSERGAANLRAAKEELGVMIFAGIMPVAGYRNALFLANEVPGIEIPDRLIASLEGLSRDAALDISLAYAAETVAECCDDASGFYLMTPIRRVDLIEGLIGRCFDV
jgi:homocysteine S-methyltransferase